MTRLRCRAPGTVRLACAFFIISLCLGVPLAAQRPGATPGAPARRSVTEMPPAGPGTSLENQLRGSLPQGTATADALVLSLNDAVQRGLRYNLGIATGEQSTRFAAAARLAALSTLLPNLTGSVSETSQQVNLKAFGFGGFPGLPTIVGPFNVFDARAALTQAIFNWSAIQAHRSAGESERAAALALDSVREAVVLVTVDLYLRAIASAARVETAAAQLRTAETEFRQATDMRNAGVAAGIDVLRAQVEQQTQQQRLIAFRNDRDKDLLTLARVIGLPPGQRITLSDRGEFTPSQPLPLEQALEKAYASRPDYQAALAAERAAALTRNAARSQRFPAVYFAGNYGAIGPSPIDSHGTYSASAVVDFPIFEGGRIRSDVMRAEAALEQRRAEAADLRGRIDQEVRSALLDLQAARQQVEVSQSTLALAERQLVQAQDRFRAGVTNNLEVVQSQAALAAANENVISSIYAYNLARVSLSRAIGAARTNIKDFLGASSP